MLSADDTNACRQVVLAVFDALDRNDPTAVADQFAVDGNWHRQGVMLTGRDDILAATSLRPAGRATCHVITNLRFTSNDVGAASAAYLLTAYENSPDGSPRLVAIRSCEDRLTRTTEGWLIASKRSQKVLPLENA